MPVCAACQQDNPDIARFCLTCGARLAPAPPAQEERRVISAIFVDLVGSTSRAEMSDPEDVRAMLSLYYDRVPSVLGLKAILPDAFQRAFRFRRSSHRVVS